MKAGSVNVSSDLIGSPVGAERPVEEMVRPADAAQRRLGQADNIRVCEYRAASPGSS